MKKIAIFCSLGVIVLLTANLYATVTSATIEIEAMIDGRDWIVITGNTLQWHHFEQATVGRHWGHNEPTIITTKLNNVIQMDHVSWTPDWKEPPPAEIRYVDSSSVFTGLFPSIPATDMIIGSVTLIPIDSRWDTTLKEYTDDSVTIEFNDNPPSSHYWYRAQINIQMIPEPATVLLLGLGGLALLRKRRS